MLSEKAQMIEDCLIADVTALFQDDPTPRTEQQIAAVLPSLEGMHPDVHDLYLHGALRKLIRRGELVMDADLRLAPSANTKETAQC